MARLNLRGRLLPDDRLLEPDREGAAVDQLVGIEARNGAANHVANVVHTALLRGETGSGQTLEDPGNVLDLDPAQLDVLPGGDIRLTPPAAIRNLADRCHLLARQDAVGHAQAQHEVAGGRLAVEEPVPLQPFEVVGVYRGVPFTRVAKEVGEHIEPVLRLLQYFDLVCHRHRASLSTVGDGCCDEVTGR